MSGKGKKAIILDTCIALHYKRPDQIDWLNELDASEAEIVITPILLRELGKHKVLHASSKLRNRAGEFLKWVNSVVVDDSLRAEIRLRVFLVVLDAEPSIDFVANGLCKDVADDHLVGHLLERNSSKQNVPAAILTADTEFRMKAMGRKLPVLLWEDNVYRLPAEPNAEEKRIQQLERELQKITSRCPKLKLALASGCHVQEFALRPLSESQKTVLLKAQENDHPYESLAPSGIDISPHWSARVAPEDRKYLLGNRVSYNQALRQYYEAYRKYLDERSEFQASVVVLEMRLINSGTAPAENIDVNLSLPKDLQIEPYYSIPEPPVPPTLENPLASLRSPSLLVSDPLRGQGRGLTYDPIGGEYKYHVTKLKHNTEVTLGPLFAAMGNAGEVKPITISYTVTTDSHPDKLGGKLVAKIRREDAIEITALVEDV